MPSAADSVRFFAGRILYRFFDTAEHADALTQGHVWITTFQTCRGYENRNQGDPGEGSETYSPGLVSLSGEDKNHVEIARRMGIGLTGPGKLTAFGVGSRSVIDDAYMLCTSMRFDPAAFSATFNADYCTEITDAGQFFRSVTARLRDRFGSRLRAATIGTVTYRERAYSGLDDSPGPIGFVKPQVPYKGQAEVRMVWGVGGPHSYEPFTLYVPDVAHPLCRRVETPKSAALKAEAAQTLPSAPAPSTRADSSQTAYALGKVLGRKLKGLFGK
jgi:hypothetical protein